MIRRADIEKIRFVFCAEISRKRKSWPELHAITSDVWKTVEPVDRSQAEKEPLHISCSFLQDGLRINTQYRIWCCVSSVGGPPMVALIVGTPCASNALATFS